MRFACVILAAGASVRMGRPKLLLPWGKTTILAHVIDQWRGLGAAQIGAVIGTNSVLEVHLRGVDRIVNPHPEEGMFSSIRRAATWSGWAAEISHFAIAPGDQPQIGIETLRAAIDFAAANPEYSCQPSRNGRPRHPVLMPKSLFSELARADEASLKEFLQARESRRRLVELDDPGLDVDVDTPEDYARLIASTRPASTGAPSSSGCH